MPDQITTAFVKQFADNAKLVAQQLESAFRDKVMIEPITGDKAYVDYVGLADEPQPQLSLIQDTQLDEMPHSRRVILTKPYPKAVPISNVAKRRMLYDPANPYQTALKAAYERLIDKTLMAAAIGSATYASTDALTEGSLALGAGQIYEETGTVGMTAEKVVRALETFNLNNLVNGDKWLALAPLAISDLLLDPDVSIADQMALEIVRTGQIKQVFGFNCVMSTQLPKSTTFRSNVAWVREGLCLGLNQDLVARLDERPDKNYLTQVWMCLDFGAVRLQETHVYEIRAYEAY